jgi:hypothetical protein
LSGCRQKDFKKVPDSDSVCVLQCAHPPGKPLQLWYYNGLLQEMSEGEDIDALSDVWKLLNYLDPEGGEEG